MFFCDDCEQEYQLPISISRSYGRCEMCGNPGMCYDVPSKYLSGANVSEKKTPAEKLAQQLKGKEGDDATILCCTIKDLREATGLSQSIVAQAVQTNAAAIGSVEKGNPPRLDLALKLAAFFGVKIEDTWSLEDKADASDKHSAEKP